MTLKFGVPNKGRLNERTIELLAKAGIDLGEDVGRRLYVKARNQDIEVLFLRAQDIPEFVATGAIDIGITGQDQVAEAGAQIEQVLAGRPCSLEETVRSLIREQGRLYTERLLSAVLEAGFDYHALPVVMMGGGASVVSRHIRPSDGLCRTVTLLDDRVNAQGYERAVAALWGDDAQG